MMEQSINWYFRGRTRMFNLPFFMGYTRDGKLAGIRYIQPNGTVVTI